MMSRIESFMFGILVLMLVCFPLILTVVMLGVHFYASLSSGGSFLSEILI